MHQSQLIIQKAAQIEREKRHSKNNSKYEVIYCNPYVSFGSNDR